MTRIIKKKTGLIESQLPTHLIDIVQLAKAQLGWQQNSATAQLFAFFLQNMIDDHYTKAMISRQLNDGLVKGKAQKSITLDCQHVTTLIAKFKAQTKTTNTSDIVRLVIFRIYEDLLKRKDEKVINELKINEEKGEAIFYA